MNENIKFNVIIPTRERADTLFHCLRTVVAQDYDNLNIIVSDNFSQDNTKAVVDSFYDSRIKYINTGKRLSMSHNWEFALDHVTEGWVTFLGDDDGILPNSFVYLSEIIKTYPVKAISSKFGRYPWPNFDPVNEYLMDVPLGSKVQVRSAREMLTKVMKGYADYFDLPWLYLGGLATIDVINNARDRQGNFFRSRSPDVYSSIALSCVIDKYLMIETPIAINGLSKHSTGSSGHYGVHKGPVEKFFSEKNIPFHPSLGNNHARSLHLSTYECYLKAMHLHEDKLGIQMKDQLSIALAKSSQQHYALLETDCRKICEKNQINFNDILQKVKVLKFCFKIRSVYRQKIEKSSLLRKKNILVNNRALFIRDIHDAVIVSYSVHYLIEKKILRRISSNGLYRFSRKILLFFKKKLLKLSKFQ